MKTLVPTDWFLARLARGFACLAIAGALWLPVIHFLFRRPVSDFWRAEGVSPFSESLALQQMRVWQDPALRQAEIKRMRQVNAEWDFMGRTFFVWSLANLSLRDPSRQAEALPIMDDIIQQTLSLEKTGGVYVFLMPYAHERSFIERPVRSLFVDGEIALMLAARQAVSPLEVYRQPLAERVEAIESRLQRSSMLSAESYPDECWMFDQAVAMAALRLADAVQGSDHRRLTRDWLKLAQERLIDRRTGLLVSRYALDGEVIEGPEGSTLWMVAHCLTLLDAGFARDQFERARHEMGRSLLGFGFAREWPEGGEGEADVDSGPIIPVLGISPGSSGLAFVGAVQFHDDRWLQELHSTLEMAAFPVRKNGGLRFAASNQVGDAVMLYASTMGPLWAKAGKGGVL